MPELPPPVKISPLIKFFRYAFLLAGIIYGAGKLKTFKALEASRTEEKAKKRAERDARLVEEKRLATERDFQQILEVFRPPTKPVSMEPASDANVAEPPVQTSGDTNLSVEGFAPQCDSSYETIYNDDRSDRTPPPVAEFESSEPQPEGDLFSKPLDLSANDELDVGGNAEDYSNENNSDYVIQDFGDSLPVLPPADRSCRIPPEN